MFRTRLIHFNFGLIFSCYEYIFVYSSVVQYFGCFLKHFLGRKRRNTANGNNDSGALLCFNLVSFFIKIIFFRVCLPGYWWYLQFTALDGTFIINQNTMVVFMFMRLINISNVSWIFAMLSLLILAHIISLWQPCKYAKPFFRMETFEIHIKFKCCRFDGMKSKSEVPVRCFGIFRKLPFLLVTAIIYWKKKEFHIASQFSTKQWPEYSYYSGTFRVWNQILRFFA